MTAEAPAGSGVGWYVYGVVEADAPRADAPGVADGVDAVVEGPLVALASRVALDEWGEEPVRARLEDPAWLERMVRAHQSVLEAALAAGPVVPFRFLTLYAGEAELRRFLVERREELVGVLGGVRGKAELGVKAFVDTAALERSAAGSSPELAELDHELAAAEGGRAYLLQRRREQLAQEESGRLLGDLARECHERLRRVAQDAVANAVQPPELSGRPEAMILNGAYLVASDDRALEREVAALADEHGERGVTFELTGPWPPYNFVPRELGER